MGVVDIDLACYLPPVAAIARPSGCSALPESSWGGDVLAKGQGLQLEVSR